MNFMTEQAPAQISNKDEFLKEIKKLSLLDKMDYELVRDVIADKFKTRVSMLDEFVEDERKKLKAHEAETDLFSKIEPWGKTVELSKLLDEIVNMLNKYVSFISSHEPRAIALWVVHTYCIDIAYITPVLFITSAEMRSGKSTLLSILQQIVSKCIAASSVSPSVIYRVIPKYRPTLIFDEADAYMTSKNEELRNVMNAGHSRSTAKILRTNPDTLEPEMFDAFGAKCVAAIRDLPGTIEDRSIIIKMQRIVKGIKKEKMRFVNEALRLEFHSIQRKCVRFVNDSIKELNVISPSLPDKLNSRAEDNWYPLLQIAELAGTEWLKYANTAALALSNIKNENKSIGIELLEDIQNIFEIELKHLSEIPTSILIDTLCIDEDAPWATYNFKRQDTRITSRQLSNLLLPYDMKRTKNIGDKKLKGYSKSAFQDAFSRYLYSDTIDTSATSASSAKTSNGTAHTDNEEKNLSAPSCSIRSHNEIPTSSKIAGADRSRTEQQNKSAETQAGQGIAEIAAIADISVDYEDECILV